MSKVKFQPSDFETSGANYVPLYRDMLDSPAWKSLSLRQRGLYLALKERYTEKRTIVTVGSKRVSKVASSNRDQIHFTEQEATKPGPNGEKLYGNRSTFVKDMDALISAGFIRVVQTGYYGRTATVYGFSTKWKEFQPGKPPVIPAEDRRRKDPDNHGRAGKKGHHMANSVMSTAIVPSTGGSLKRDPNAEKRLAV